MQHVPLKRLFPSKQAMAILWLATVSLSAKELSAGYCWYVQTGTWPTTTSNDKETRGVIPLDNHTCQRISSGHNEQETVEEKQYSLSFTGNLSGAFNGASIGLGMSISEAESVKKRYTLSFPPELPPCTHWAREYFDFYRVKTYDMHTKQFSLQYGLVEHYTGTLKHCTWHAAWPAAITATVRDKVSIIYVDNPAPSPCTDPPGCPCPGARSAARDDNGGERDERDPGPKPLGMLKREAPGLAVAEGYGLEIPRGFKVEVEGAVLRLEVESEREGLVVETVHLTKEGVLYEKDGAPPRVLESPVVLVDGTVVSAGGLVIFSNGLIAKLAGAEALDQVPLR